MKSAPEFPRMKAYLGITGSVFALIGVAHVARLFVEGHPLSDSAFLAENLGLSLVCVGLAVWAGWLLMSSWARR